MKIVTVQFDYPDRPRYSLLLKVFRESIKLYMPNVELIEFKTKAPVNRTSRPLNFNYNDFKLDIWLHYLEQADENIIFADCDMMAIRSAEHAFDIPFDVAFTQRTNRGFRKRIPINGGIMMARPTEAARKFFREMRDTNRKMLKDKNFHQEWRKIYAGMNQSAFGYVYEKGKHNAKVHEYKTIEWNAVDCDWHCINNKTVFVHYKSKLRKLILANKAPHGNYRKVMKLWYDMKNKLTAVKRKIKTKKEMEILQQERIKTNKELLENRNITIQKKKKLVKNKIIHRRKTI